MSAPFDSLQFVRILRDRGNFTVEQAESIADALALALHGDLATKADLAAGFAQVDARLTLAIGQTNAKIADSAAESNVRFGEINTKIAEAVGEINARMEKSIGLTNERIADSKAEILKWLYGAIGFQTVALIGAAAMLAHFGH